MRLMNVISRKNLTGASLEKVFYCFLFVAGVFCIPSCFISRHVTAGVLGVALLVGVYSVIWAWRARAIRITPLFLLVLLFSACWLFYQFFSSALAWHGWIEYISFVLLFFVFGQRDFDERCLKRYYFICSVVGVCMSFWGIFQYLGVAQVYNRFEPVTGSFENPAGVAIFLASLLPASLFFVKKRGKWSRVWGYFACLFSCVVVLLSNSRTGVLIVILLCLLYFFQNRSFARWSKGNKKYLLAGVIACVFLLFVGLYYWKKDSADGRILIWLCSWDMFREHWLAGVGSGRFQAEYMLYQAEYFRQNPDSVFAMLADSVKHPFNEYLKILVEYGILGFSLFMVAVTNLVRTWWGNREKVYLFPVFGSVLAIAVGAFFSYPLDYPGIVLVLVLNMAVLSYYQSVIREIGRKSWVKFVAVGGVIFALLFLGVVCSYGRAEYEWNKIARASLAGETREMLPRYQKLCRWMGQEGLFLYNFGAELQQVGEYEASTRVLERCCSRLNDYDVQLLLAENYTRLNMHERAKECLLTASDMCPVRFVPLYKLMNICLKEGKTEEAKRYAQNIVNKPIKIHSMRVDRIKDMARQVLR